jgi:hypothetical protein
MINNYIYCIKEEQLINFFCFSNIALKKLNAIKKQLFQISLSKEN